MVLICLSGKRFHGKSTVADYLVHKYHMKELAFAHPLKDMCQTVFGFSHDQMYNPHWKEVIDPFWGITPRCALQDCGQMMRDKYGSIWVKALARRLQQQEKDSDIVVSDCRYPDEWKQMKELGAVMVRVTRLHSPQDHDEVSSHHPSETSLDNLDLYTPDYVLVNDGTLEELHDKIRKMMNNLLTRD
jgi:hypothetical protein